MISLPEHKKIILFDGVCDFCNSWINFISKHDKKDTFRFVSLQSKLGQAIIKHIGIDCKIDSVVFYEPKKAYYIKSEAVFEIVKNIDFHYYKIILLFKFLPISITDKIYDFIAKNRFKWNGKTKNCLMTSSKLKAKFLN